MQVVILPSVLIVQGLDANLNWRMRDRAADAYVDLTDWVGVFSMYDKNGVQLFTSPLNLYNDGMIAINIPSATTATLAGGRDVSGLNVVSFQIDLNSPDPALSQKWQGAVKIERNLAQ